MERSIGLVVSELAILKAGCAFTPIDPAYPPDRILFMADDVEAGLILAGHNMSVDGLGSRLVCLKDIDTKQYGTDDLGDLAGPDSMAYVIYTSGSTGQPKGVIINHRGIVRLVTNTNYAEIHPDDNVSFTSNPTFDVSMFDIWGALLNGACLVIFDKETLLSPAGFASLLEKERVTVLTLTTQLFNLYSLEIPEAFRRVRDVYFAGEAADPNSVRRVLANRPSGRLVNAYGPTENSVYSICYDIRDVPGDNVPIGRPVSNSTAYVLDEYLCPLPIGAAGEIYVGGDGVARGYHKRPELTAAAFIPDPFAGGDAKLYRTGDTGCYLPDGNIRFIGRRDSQVKIRGFRVEPGEVKAALETHPSVKEAFILAEPHAGGKRLVAYLTVKGSLEASALKKYLKDILPEYMVPSAFVTMEAFPLTPNGKIDAKAFPKPGTIVARAGAPADELEKSLAGIWEEVLGISHIGMQDNFFDMGGHSLTAVRLLAKVDERLKVRLAVNTIFLYPTIGGMADTIRGDLQTSPLLLRGGSLKPPLFCITAIGGTLAEYRPMLEHFHTDREAYALQMPWHDPAGIPASIEELASRLLKDARVVQPEGPYYLLGYCAAGAVAYEMARQIQAAGEKVAFLGFIDLVPPAPKYGPDLRTARILVDTVLIVTSNIIGASRGQRLKMVRSLPPAARQFLGIAFPTSKKHMSTEPQIIAYPSWVLDLPDPYKEASIATYNIYRRYAFGQYKGNITAFISQDNMDHYMEAVYHGRSLGWEKYVNGNVSTRVIPGDHVTMTRPPNVQELARAVEECLEESERGSR